MRRDLVVAGRARLHCRPGRGRARSFHSWHAAEADSDPMDVGLWGDTLVLGGKPEPR
jgi:hypothetical protein